MNGVFTRPQESSAALVKGVDRASGKKQSRHQVGRHTIEDGVDENQAPGMVEEDGFLARELLVNLSDERSKSREVELHI